MTYFDTTDLKIPALDCTWTLLPKYTFASVDKVVPEVKRIIFHNPATIVFWKDETKTVVKCMEGQEFSKYYGFLAAVAKKCYGNNSKINRMIEKYGEDA